MWEWEEMGNRKPRNRERKSFRKGKKEYVRKINLGYEGELREEIVE